MAIAALLILGLAGLSAAQSTSVTTLNVPGFDPQPIVGSVIGANSAATTYFIACPSGTGDTECGLGQGLTVVEGPGTFALYITSSVGFTDTNAGSGFETLTMDEECSVTSNVATCTGSRTRAAGSGTVVTTSTSAETMVATLSPIPVTLTAGLEKLSGSSSSKAGVPRVTQQAVLAGVAAVVGGAMFV